MRNTEVQGEKPGQEGRRCTRTHLREEGYLGGSEPHRGWRGTARRGGGRRRRGGGEASAEEKGEGVEEGRVSAEEEGEDVEEEGAASAEEEGDGVEIPRQ